VGKLHCKMPFWLQENLYPSNEIIQYIELKHYCPPKRSVCCPVATRILSSRTPKNLDNTGNTFFSATEAVLAAGSATPKTGIPFFERTFVTSTHHICNFNNLMVFVKSKLCTISSVEAAHEGSFYFAHALPVGGFNWLNTQSEN